MWAVTLQSPPRQFLPLIPNPTKSPRPRLLASTVSADSSIPPLNQRRQNRRDPPPKSDGALAEAIGGLGQSILAAVDSNPSPRIPKEKQKQEKVREEKQISGSDVLWALQRATAQKKKKSGDKRKKKKENGFSSSAGDHTGEDRVDYNDVRPLRIKSEWGPKLDEFERRLKELEETI